MSRCPWNVLFGGQYVVLCVTEMRFLNIYKQITIWGRSSFPIIYFVLCVCVCVMLECTWSTVP